MRITDLQAHYGDRINVTWKSYILQLQPRSKPIEKFRDYTRRWSHEQGPAAYEDRVVFNTWADATPPTHSIPPLLAGKVAETFGSEAFDRFHMALMTAYFTDNRTISDKVVILEVAAECELDSGEFETRLRGRGAEFQRLVISEMDEGISLGVTGAPTVVFNNILPIAGAQDLETYIRVIDKMLAR